ncbi:hypothetical protein FQN54_003027 [Arachnomyces sp. PD_36]|nr:hypothetical protein FQN54_003027 [Arachnomyces sp. PD_36]
MDFNDWLLSQQPDAEEPQVEVEIDELEVGEVEYIEDIEYEDTEIEPPSFTGPIYTPLIDEDAASEASTVRGRPTMAAGGASPSSSPRLPSPPPFTEVQIGPASPTVSDSFGNVSETQPEGAGEAAEGPLRRIRPGTSAADMAAGPPLVPLSDLDSPFQLQEHLKALHYSYTNPDNSRTVLPITREIAQELAEPPEGIERSLWLYELCRFLTMKTNNIITAFFKESPPCSAQTCPEMRASEWQYLCAVHDPPKSCCAIDYCCHTLDWASNILTSPKYFPSRLTLGSEAGGGPQTSMKHLTNIFRRLYRIFAHAWFQHRDVFWQVEGHDGLYVFFKTVCDVYNLIPEDNYTIPAEAEGIDAEETTGGDAPKVTLLQRDSDSLASSSTPVNAGATTRRHKHTPSTGASVTTISEGVEEAAENEAEDKKLSNLEEDTVLELPKVTEQDVENENVGPETRELPIREGLPIEIMAEEDDTKEETEEPVAESEQSGEATTEEVTEETKPGETEPEPDKEPKPAPESEEKESPETAEDDKKTEETAEPPETPTDPEPESDVTKAQAPSEVPDPSSQSAEPAETKPEPETDTQPKESKD